jgi:hypothetical protein
MLGRKVVYLWHLTHYQIYSTKHGKLGKSHGFLPKVSGMIYLNIINKDSLFCVKSLTNGNNGYRAISFLEAFHPCK